MKRAILHALALAMSLLLAACGFQLRSQAPLPFKSLYVGFPDNSVVGAELKRYIRATGDSQVATDPKTADAVLELLSETREKTILTLNSQGRVREYSLFYKLRFRVKDRQERELLAPTEIVLRRDLTYNEAQAIAKEKEEEMLYRDMQSDVVRQILRRLAAVKTA